jgi:hypothetical protein
MERTVYYIVTDWKSQTPEYADITAVAFGPYAERIDAEEFRVVQVMPFCPSVVVPVEFPYSTPSEWFVLPARLAPQGE